MTTVLEGGGSSTTTAARTTSPPPPRMVDSRFYCNICLDPVVDPVATLCGHLYCWPCLYRWLEPGMTPHERANLLLGADADAATAFANHPGDSNRRVCPVCKAPCSVPSLVPIYVRESEATEYEEATRKAESDENHPRDRRTLTEGSDDSSREGAPAVGESSQEAASASHGGTRVGGNDTDNDEDNDAAGGLSRDGMTGLRQRIRFRSHDSYTSVDSTASAVPSRPLAQSPRELSPVHSTNSTTAALAMATPPRFTTNNNGTSWATQLTPTAHRPGSLAHGFLMSIQQATTGNSGIPPLHHHRRWDGTAAGGDDGTHGNDLDAAHSGATEYLSRLLFMFSSFVILCLLLM